MKVLVTGSSGFIGQHLVRALSHQGYTVMGLDIHHPKAAPEGFSFRICNILDGRELEETLMFFQPHFIVHLAARVDLDEEKDIRGYAVNIDGVANLVAAIRSTSTIRRCIFTSSQLVCQVGYQPVDNEDYKTNTLYGESKVLSERIVRGSDGGGAEWCIVRPTTVWGPGMSSHYQRLFKMIKRGWYVHVGHRPLSKSYGFVGNIAHQYIKLLEAPTDQIYRRTFYLADYRPVALRDWTDAFQRSLGARPIKTCPERLARVVAKVGDVINAFGFKSFPFNSFRLGNVLSEYQFDLSETENVCGALPYTVEDGIERTVAWLLLDGSREASASAR